MGKLDAGQGNGRTPGVPCMRTTPRAVPAAPHSTTDTSGKALRLEQTLFEPNIAV